MCQPILTVSLSIDHCILLKAALPHDDILHGQIDEKIPVLKAMDAVGCPCGDNGRCGEE